VDLTAAARAPTGGSGGVSAGAGGGLQSDPVGVVSGRLETIADVIIPGLSVRLAYGHTDAMMLPQVSYKGKTVVFMADLLPSIGHIPIPYVMAYDMFPLTTLKEKKSFLAEAAAGGYVLFFEHDPENECCVVETGEKGLRGGNGFRLEEV
jgi:glyoxylase-like metal-dependent hydrolase (beta-lactamase superfamily II)